MSVFKFFKFPNIHVQSNLVTFQKFHNSWIRLCNLRERISVNEIIIQRIGTERVFLRRQCSCIIFSCSELNIRKIYFCLILGYYIQNSSIYIHTKSHYSHVKYFFNDKLPKWLGCLIKRYN